jgi:two-component system copper resistance phosphate regulon response regulator CusR
MRIFIVEDDRRMAELLRQGLSEEGHTAVVASNGRDAFDIAKHEAFDLLILDVMLPGIDGFTIARRLREMDNRTPILMLTARDTTQDVVQGLDLGADDYLTKPFSFDVLFARVRAVARRGPLPRGVHLHVGDLSVDEASREIRRGDRRVDLTKTEYAILELLMRNAGRVVERERLIESVWGHDTDIESNTLDAFVRLLRGKLEHAGESKMIHTVRGVGYVLRVGE